MRRFKLLTATAFALLALVFLASPIPSHAQEPRYLHALSNLRQARAWLQFDHNPNSADARHHAVDEIDAAIKEVKMAAHDDGRDTNFTPPPDARAEGGGPSRSAQRLLEEASDDIKFGRDNPENAGLQVRARQHITEAIYILHNMGNR
jgi:hypothetical protein